jgi:hypothetical protein
MSCIKKQPPHQQAGGGVGCAHENLSDSARFVMRGTATKLSNAGASPAECFVSQSSLRCRAHTRLRGKMLNACGKDMVLGDARAPRCPATALAAIARSDAIAVRIDDAPFRLHSLSVQRPTRGPSTGKPSLFGTRNVPDESEITPG